MTSLTKILDKIKNKATYFERLIPSEFFKYDSNLEIINPYPEWVNQYKKWALFGTFTDYMIRKIIHIHYPTKIISENIIAYKAIDLLPSSDFKTQALEWTNRYTDDNLTWEESLLDTFKMSHLDRYYRAKELESFTVPDDLVIECIPFFDRIESWIVPLFDNGIKISLNPPIGINFGADPDLIIDDTIYEIKTVKQPKKYVSMDYYQLLGYAAIAEKRGFETNRIGYIFPLQLKTAYMNIINWNSVARSQFLEKVTDALTH